MRRLLLAFTALTPCIGTAWAASPAIPPGPPALGGTGPGTFAAGNDLRFSGRLPRNPGPPRIVNLATGPVFPNAISPTRTTSAGRKALIMRGTSVDGKIGLAFPGYYATVLGEANSGQTHTWSAALLSSDGTCQVATFNGGAATGVAQPGGIVLTDRTLNAPPDGQMFWVFSYQVAPGGIVSKGSSALNLYDNEKIRNDASGTPDNTAACGDIINTGTPSTTAGNSNVQGPIAVFGLSSEQSFIGIGNSRMAGTGDTYLGTDVNLGAVAPSIGAYAPFMNYGIGGDRFSALNAFGAQRIADANMFATAAVLLDAINDVDNQQSFTTIRDNLLAIKGKLTSLSAVYLATTYPHTNSADNWATPGLPPLTGPKTAPGMGSCDTTGTMNCAAGQSPATNGQTAYSGATQTVRVSLNDWCRTSAVAAGFRSCIDVDDVVATGRNQPAYNTWNGVTLGVPNTLDGLHLNWVGVANLRRSGIFGWHVFARSPN